MRQYVDPNSFADNAGGISVSKKKFTYIRDKVLKIPFLKKIDYNRQFDRVNAFLCQGDTQPALVISLHPLVISAYSDEMDAVVLLQFPDKLADMYGLREGTRLVTSNVYRYGTGSEVASDIIPGSGYMHRYSNVIPIVQLFFSDDEEYIKSRIRLFDEDQWDRLQALTEEKLRHNIKMRDGFYYFYL